MIPPPDNVPNRLLNAYHEMYDEMRGRVFQHDEYSELAQWFLVYLRIERPTCPDTWPIRPQDE